MMHSIHSSKVYNTYRSATSDGHLADALITMARNAGLESRACSDLAQQIMAQVEDYEYTCDLVSEDVCAAMDQFFASLDEATPTQRMDILNQLHFGFEIFSDEELLSKLSGGISGEMLYREYCPEPVAWTPAQEKIMRRLLQCQVANLRLSPKALERITKKLTKTSDYVACSAALGRDGYALKCAVAMDLYLRNRDTVTPEEAVLDACVYTDLEAIADGVRMGEIAENVSLALMVVKLISVAITAGGLLLASETLGELLIVSVIALAVMEAVSLAGGFISRQIGKLVTACSGQILAGTATLKAGLDRIRAWAEDAASSSYDYDIDDTEAYAPDFDNAFIF